MGNIRKYDERRLTERITKMMKTIKTTSMIFAICIAMIGVSCLVSGCKGGTSGKEPQETGVDLTGLDPDKPVIALTFDDGPNTTTTLQILNILEEYGVTASFFLIGNNINSSTAYVVAKEVEMGFEVNSHSNAHDYMNQMGMAAIQIDMDACATKIYEAGGVYPKFFRPPYIAVSPTMYESIDLPFICGYGCNDWDASVTAQERIDAVLSHAKDGEIILLHDAAGNRQTVEALPAIIEGLQAEGYQFVTCSQLFAIKGIEPQSGVLYTTVYDGN